MIKRIWDITLTVSDLKKSVDFYSRILGLQKKYEFNDYAGFDCCGIEIGLKTWGQMEKPSAGEPRINFLIDDLEEMEKILSDNGVNILKGPEDTQWGGRIIVFSDPDGNVIQVTRIDWRKYFRSSAT